MAGAPDEVELTFLDPVLPGVAIEVREEDGRPVSGLGDATLSDDGRVAEIGFDALESGAYVVEYRFTAQDGDTQEEAYRFTVLADADSGLSTVDVVGLVVVLAAVLAAVLISLLRRRN